MNGLQLSGMELSDMLDVLHYYLEEDFRYSSEYEPVYKDHFRRNIYKSMYGSDYKYMNITEEDYTDSRNLSENPDYFMEKEDEQPEEILEPFNPRSPKTVQPYIEPSPLLDGSLPFGSILDAPIE